ncbi:hypothetical protein HKD37_11G031257 [Glycine soja]
MRIKGIDDENNIDKKCSGDKNKQGSDGSEGVRTTTSEGSQLDLHQIHKSHHQKPASEHRPKSRNESSKPQNDSVNFCNTVNPVVVVVVQNGVTLVDVLAEVDDVFESQGDEAGK